MYRLHSAKYQSWCELQMLFSVCQIDCFIHQGKIHGIMHDGRTQKHLPLVTFYVSMKLASPEKVTTLNAVGMWTGYNLKLRRWYGQVGSLKFNAPSRSRRTWAEGNREATARKF